MKHLRSEIAGTPEADRMFVARNLSSIRSALNTLTEHYDNGNTWDQMLVRLQVLVKFMPYEPYGKSVYRMFPIQAKDVDTETLAVGDVVKVRTGYGTLQCWTTSAKIAERIFHDMHNYTDPSDQTKGARFAVVRYADTGKEVMNLRYLVKVAQRLAVATKPKDWHGGYTKEWNWTANSFYRNDVVPFIKTLKNWAYQDEVLMLIPKEPKRVVIEKLLVRRGR